MAITGINGIYIGDGAGGFVDYDVINGRVLTILSNGSLGLYATALIENPGQVRAGTVVYRKTEMIKTGSFAPKRPDGTGGIVQQTPQIASVLVNLNTYKAAMYKLDDFDMAAITQMGELEAQIALGLSKSTMARLDAELFENIKEFLRTHPTNTITIPNFSTTSVIEDMRINRLKLNDLIADIESQITPQMIGTEEFNTTTIMNKKAYGRFLEGIAQSGGSLGTELRLAGQIPGQLIGGNAILKHIYIGQDIDSTVLTLDKVLATDYDFSKIEALLWSKDAIAFPTDFVSVSSMRSEFDGNLIFIQKFRFGFKVLRPELIRGILNAAFTREDAPKSINNENNGIETVNMDDLRTHQETLKNLTDLTLDKENQLKQLDENIKKAVEQADELLKAKNDEIEKINQKLTELTEFKPNNTDNKNPKGK